MADVFISYSSEERAQAEKLAAALEARGYSVWWDRNLEGGADFSDDIEREMHAAGAIVVAWSRAAAKSHWVRDEASYGRDAKKLVPITLDGSQPPIGFRQVQTINFTGWSGGDDDRVARLGSAIDRCCGKETTVAAGAPATPTKSKGALILALVSAAFMLAVAGWWFTRDGGGEGTEVAQQTAVAVLPFRSLSVDEDDKYFAEGVTEEILNRLAALPELRVTARSSSFQFADSDQPLNEIADQLDVTHIVEGSVRRGGDQWRVTAQLVRASDGTQLWSDSYDATGEDILTVQAEIAERAAEALGVLLDSDKQEAMARAGIDNPEAYALFAEGLDEYDDAHSTGNQYAELGRTVELMDRAFELEPRFWQTQLVAVDRPSHLVLDHAMGQSVSEEVTPQEALRDIRDRLARARANAPPSAHGVLDQQAMIYANDWSGAGDIIRSMLRERSNCQIGASYDFFLVEELGLQKDFKDFSRHSLACDPLGGPSGLILAALMTDDDALLREAMDAVDETRAFGPDLRGKVLGHIKFGEIDKAREVLNLMDRNTFYFFQSSIYILAAEGDLEELKRLYALGGTYDEFPDAPRLQFAALMGDRALANEIAARIDARTGGTAWLGVNTAVTCFCGRPFDLSATPNYAARLKEAGADKPPRSIIDWPLKDW